MRIPGVDLSRGVALLAVFVAHTAPVGHASPLPERLLLWADNLAAPLFAVLFGASAGLAARAAESAQQTRVQFRVGFAVRALGLIALGVIADLSQHSVIPILHYLGAVGFLLMPVLRLRARWLILLAAAAVAVSAGALPWAQRVSLTLRMHAIHEEGPAWIADWSATLLGFALSDFGYRVSGLLAFALAGLAVGRIALRGRRRVVALFTSGAALTAGALIVGHWMGISTAAYAGTAPELVNAIGLSCIVIAACCALSATPLRKVLAPIYALGSVTLTFYVAHIGVLGFWAAVTGLSDDKWSMLLALSAGSLAGAWLIRRRWRRGPLEWLLHQAGRAVAGPRRAARLPAQATGA